MEIFMSWYIFAMSLCLVVYVGYNLHLGNHRILRARYVNWRTARAYAWLRKHDHDYQRELISKEVTRRREEVRQRGGTAQELDEIDIFSVAKELGIGSKL